MEPTLDVRSYRPEQRSHQHDFHQLVLPLTGRMEMAIDRHDGVVAARRAAVIPAGTGHHFTVHGCNRFIVADVPAALAPDLARLPPFVDLEEGLGRYVLFLEHELHRQATGMSRPSVSGNHQMLLLLVHLLTERCADCVNVDERLAAARGYLDSRLDQPVRLAEIARIAHLSSRQLTELFRRYFDMSPGEYLVEQRMQRARQLLTQTRLSVQQVAERCGYGDLSAFSRRFSHHFGRAPSRLRRESADSAND